jgi:hypothetical protein
LSALDVDRRRRCRFRIDSHLRPLR